jgi:hypothetical protein
VRLIVVEVYDDWLIYCNILIYRLDLLLWVELLLMRLHGIKLLNRRLLLCSDPFIILINLRNVVLPIEIVHIHNLDWLLFKSIIYLIWLDLDFFVGFYLNFLHNFWRLYIVGLQIHRRILDTVVSCPSYWFFGDPHFLNQVAEFRVMLF